MRLLTSLTVIGFLLSCTLLVKAENPVSSSNTITISLLDLTDKDTTLSKVHNENDGEKKIEEKEEIVEEEAIEITIELSPKQKKAYEDANMPSDDELDVIEIGIITPSTRYDQPSEDTEETMIMMVDEETGEEYFIRKNYAPAEFKELQDKRKYKRKAKKIEAQGMKSST